MAKIFKNVKYNITPHHTKVAGQAVVYWELRRSTTRQVIYASPIIEQVVEYFETGINHFERMTRLVILDEKRRKHSIIFTKIDENSEVIFDMRIYNKDVVKFLNTRKRYVLTQHIVKDGEITLDNWILKRRFRNSVISETEDLNEAIDKWKQFAIERKTNIQLLVKNKEHKVIQIINSDPFSPEGFGFFVRNVLKTSNHEYYITSKWSKNQKGIPERMWGIKKPGLSSFMFASPVKQEVELFFKTEIDHTEYPGVAYVYGKDGEFEKVIRAHENLASHHGTEFSEHTITNKDEVTREVTLNTATMLSRIVVFSVFGVVFELVLFLSLHLGGYI